MSAKARRSRSRAASMRCGPKAACNTPRRSDSNCSPDGAPKARNPGFPHYASLHAGYDTEESSMRVTTKLRQLLAGGRSVVAPGVFDGLSARLTEQAGFAAVYA